MKILYITTISETMIFFPNLIRSLLDDGHIVDIACNEVEKIIPCYLEWGCTVYPLNCSRSPFSKGNINAIGQIKRLVAAEQYDIVHCHTPIAAACARLACRKARKTGTKVVYTAHGFHFFKGAPLVNWLIYYPIEKLCAHFTDVQITINAEDYALAKRKLRAKCVEYIPGVGVDLSRFGKIGVSKAEKRRELGIPEDASLLLSVGELNDNKNQQVIVRAMAQLQDPSVHYMLAGVGQNAEKLRRLSKELGIEENVHLLGFRRDIPELCAAADIFCFPSLREGLGLASIEAMACGLPLVTSNVHGINDYSENGITGYKCAPNDVEGFAKAIHTLVDSKEQRQQIGESNRVLAQKYDVVRIIEMMKKLYTDA